MLTYNHHREKLCCLSLSPSLSLSFPLPLSPSLPIFHLRMLTSWRNLPILQSEALSLPFPKHAEWRDRVCPPLPLPSVPKPWHSDRATTLSVQTQQSLSVADQTFFCHCRLQDCFTEVLLGQKEQVFLTLLFFFFQGRELQGAGLLFHPPIPHHGPDCSGQIHPFPPK